MTIPDVIRQSILLVSFLSFSVDDDFITFFIASFLNISLIEYFADSNLGHAASLLSLTPNFETKLSLQIGISTSLRQHHQLYNQYHDRHPQIV